VVVYDHIVLLDWYNDLLLAQEFTSDEKWGLYVQYMNFCVYHCSPQNQWNYDLFGAFDYFITHFDLALAVDYSWFYSRPGVFDVLFQ